MDKVFLGKCEGYDVGGLESVLREGLGLLKIDLALELTDKKILLKPNMLGAYAPDKAVTTHPVFVEALIRVLKDFDCELWLGDSPNGVQPSLEVVWKKTGMMEICGRYGVKPKFFEREGATFKNGVLISNPVLAADYIINLPKLKTHGLTLLTIAVKNMFGVVPGLQKTVCHREATTRGVFARELVKIAETVKPQLNVVDGIVAMAGNGPSGGYPVGVGLVTIGKNMHAVDMVVAELLNLRPEHMDTIDAALKMGVIDPSMRPEIVGRAFSEFNLKDFRLPVSYTANLMEYRYFHFIISKLMSLTKVRPRVEKVRCKKCRMCVGICPVSAVTIEENYPVIDEKKCIECYCCHEVCPENAVKLQESFLLRVMKFLNSFKK